MTQKTNKIIFLIGIVLILGLFLWGISIKSSLKTAPQTKETLKNYGELFYQACKEVYIYDYSPRKPFVTCAYDPLLLEKEKGLILPTRLHSSSNNELKKNLFNALILNIGNLTFLENNFQNDQVLCAQIKPAIQNLKSFPVYSTSLDGSEKYAGVWLEKYINEQNSQLICLSALDKGEIFYLGLIFFVDNFQEKYNLKILKFPLYYKQGWNESQIINSIEKATVIYETDFEVK